MKICTSLPGQCSAHMSIKSVLNLLKFDTVAARRFLFSITLHNNIVGIRTIFADESRCIHRLLRILGGKSLN